jgi:hypothetical protein
VSGYVVQFRVRGSADVWWYLGAYDMGTNDPTHAIVFSAKTDAWEKLEQERWLRPGCVLRVVSAPRGDR